MLLSNSVKPAPESAPQPTVQSSIQESIQHINCVTHEGKVLLVGTDASGQLWYTAKQDGFEDSYLQQPEADRKGWEDWQLLELPNENNDQSVLDKEKAELTDEDGKYLLRSLYKTHDQSAIAPVQLVSALGYVYVFRQSKSKTLLVDRFVLDSLTNTLNRKLDVRFKRSRQKHEPIQSPRKGGSGLLNVDALDFTDIQGYPFYEPSTELSLVSNLQNGWFSVVLLPTQEQDKYRWHIFAYNSESQSVEITTLRASEEGLFDVKDYTVLDPEPRRISGITKRTLNLGNGVTVANGITATRYDVQRERETEAKDDAGKVIRQLLRESVRVMLVIGTDRGSAIALSFAVAADGTLSKIAAEHAESQICRSVTRQILLPPNMLDDIKAIARVKEPRQGSITQFKAGKDNEVIAVSSEPTGLKPTEMMQVTVTGNRDYNGLHSSVIVIDDNNFEITLPNNAQADNKESKWEEVLPPDTGLLYNGMITACEMTPSGKLKVTAFNHGLKNGDAVQIENTKAYDGTYTVSKIDDQTFCLEGVSWQAGTAINVREKTEKRRGIVLDGKSDHITLPPINHDFSQGLTVEAWVYFDQLTASASIIDFGNGAEADNIILQIGSVSDEDGTKPAELGLTLRQDYDLQLIAAGGADALPSTGNRLIAIARDEKTDQLSLKIFNAQGTVVFSHPETPLAGKASDQEVLKLLLKFYWNVAKLLPTDQKKIVEAVRAVLPTQTPAIATQDEQSISISDVLETKRWMHLAATIDETGQATLYKDGESIKTGSLKLPPSLRRSQNYLGRSNRTPAVYWPGKLSQVRLWNRACSADEIKNGMMLPAREQAAGLVGDWRLDAIATGTQRTVVDFSINGNDGTVMGDNAYINHLVVLPRTLKVPAEGSTIVVQRYVNEDLFAVSESATYREEFEFRLQDVAAGGTVSTVIDVSGLTFTYKGKKNHKAEAWDYFPEKQETPGQVPGTITDLKNGWYKASCQFTVPDGVALVRSFGIENIDSTSQWTQIEIRRHQITLESDSITAETYSDTLEDKLQFKGADTPQSAQTSNLEKLALLEQAEGVLLLRKQALERGVLLLRKQALERAENSPLSTIQNPQQQIKQQQTKVAHLESEYQTMKESPFYYWCYIVAKHSNRCIEAALNQWSNGASITQGSEFKGENKGKWATQWKFEQLDGDCYKIVNRYAGFNTNLCLDIGGKKKSENYSPIQQWSWGNAEWQKWEVIKLNDESYKILSKHSSDKGLDVSGTSSNDGARIQLFDWSPAPSRQWLIKTGDPLDDRDAKIAAKKRELDAAKEELQELQDNLQLREDQQNTQAKLDAVSSQLGSVQKKIQDLERALKLDTPSLLEMRSIATDDRQLTTQGIVLDFVRPASRISAIETCEGNVQLSYFNKQGRMCLTNFDAAADSNNTTFEEWLPDPQQNCLNFSSSSSAVTLEKPIAVDNEWTIEAWFFYPFPANAWTVLMDGNSDRQPIVVRDGKHLGTRIGDRFYSSGYNLKNLAPGWHHLAAVGKGSTTDTTTAFYIDGKEVGKTISTASLSLDGENDYLDCGDKIDLASKSFTIEFWAKRASLTTSNQNQFILSQGSTERSRGLHIGFRNDNRFTFAFYDGTNSDLNTAPYTDTDWHHWACVYDAESKNRQIYCDGKKVAEHVATANYSGTGSLFIGKAWEQPKFKGRAISFS